MIIINTNTKDLHEVFFVYEDIRSLKRVPDIYAGLFSGKYLESCFLPVQGKKSILLMGMGKKDEIDRIRIKEIFAKAAKEMKKRGMPEYAADLEEITEYAGIRSVRDAAEGTLLGLYEFRAYKEEGADTEPCVSFNGIREKDRNEAEIYIKEILNLIEGVIFARNMVNTPGNRLRPIEFAKETAGLMKNTKVAVEQLVYGQIKSNGMEALASVGKSSEYPPCFMILRYMGNPESKEILGLVGKGVTCDTGGYCLKPAASMGGIKGDMAGGAAVAGAIYGLAKNEVRTNVIGLIPMCENRISPGSLLPGDVISSMSGKTIEIVNTDAEGRLILADAVTYAIRKEKVTRILDIATLTGAVANMFGFSTAAVLADSQMLWEEFRNAYGESGERYWRLPIYPEQEKMIESEIADIKNQGDSYCSTITAGIFVKKFAEGRPWLHVDIAGTAWVENPVFEYQSKGATGAGVTTLYYLCSGVQERT